MGRAAGITANDLFHSLPPLQDNLSSNQIGLFDENDRADMPNSKAQETKSDDENFPRPGSDFLKGLIPSNDEGDGEENGMIKVSPQFCCKGTSEAAAAAQEN